MRKHICVWIAKEHHISDRWYYLDWWYHWIKKPVQFGNPHLCAARDQVLVAQLAGRTPNMKGPSSEK